MYLFEEWEYRQKIAKNLQKKKDKNQHTFFKSYFYILTTGNLNFNKKRKIFNYTKVYAILINPAKSARFGC